MCSIKPEVLGVAAALSISFVQIVPAGAQVSPSQDEPAATAAEAFREMLDDKKILYVTHVANSGEVDLGKLAERRARDPRVREFAAMMVAHHADADKKGIETAQRLKLGSETSPVSYQLTKDENKNLKKLRSTSAADFDAAYLDSQVKVHKKVLSLIDKQLMPNASDPSVQELLRDIRPTVANHLEQAKALKESLKE
jgi:putative membrane protein